MSFALNQQKALRAILRAGSGSSVFTQLGIAKLASYKGFDLLYQSFCRAVPVTSPRVFADNVAKMVQGNTGDILSVWGSPHLLSRGKPLAAVMWRGVPMPVSRAEVADFLTVEAGLKKKLLEQGIPLKGSFFYLNEVEPVRRHASVPLLPWATLVDEARGWWRKRWVKPRAALLPEGGNSRYQWFSAQLDQLRQVGKGVDVLVAHAQTLLDFSLYVSQQEGRFVPFREICPNLKVFLFNGYDPGLQRTELGYVLAGLDHLKWMQCYSKAGCMLMWQGDINIRQRLEIFEEGSCFYEFVPVEDVYADGRFVRTYRRLHAGQIEAGREYVMVVTTPGGMMAVSSGQIVKVLQVEPFRCVMKGPVIRLNGLGELFREDGVVEALANINMALQGSGVFVRDALLGHVLTERQPIWVLEVSRPVNEVSDMVLDSIAKRLHSEMDLRHEGYRLAFRQGSIRPPQVHIVPMGTFAAATPYTPDFGIFDHSPDAAHVKKIVAAAWQSKQVSV